MEYIMKIMKTGIHVDTIYRFYQTTIFKGHLYLINQHNHVIINNSKLSTLLMIQITGTLANYAPHRSLFIHHSFDFFFAHAASASFIRLDTSVATDIDKNSLGLKISVSNKGDEPAHAVQAEIVIGQEIYFSHKQPTLEVARTIHFDQLYPAKIEKQGVYPVVVIIHYSDANGYPFSALLCRTFSHNQNAPVAEIFGEMAPVNLSKKGKDKNSPLKNNRKNQKSRRQRRLLHPKNLKSARKNNKLRFCQKHLKS